MPLIVSSMRRVPLQTPLVDDSGNLTRPLILFFEQAASGSAGALTLQVEGTLAIGSNLAPVVVLREAVQPAGVAAYVKQAPVGAGISIRIKLGSATWLDLTIPAGTTSVTAPASAVAAAGALAAATPIELHLTGVGTTYPGADSSVFIYF